MKRHFLLYFLISITGIILIGRLFQLQVLKNSTNDFHHNSAIKIEFDYPDRGYIYDRNHKLLVANEISYDVMVIPNEVKTLDTLEFCSLLRIDKKDFKKRYRKAKRYSPILSSVFLKQLDKNDFAFLQEKLHKYKGFSVQKRTIRKYPIKSAANILGYISEVDENTAKKNSYYESGELIGFWGIEKEYEENLRGKKGRKLFSRNRFNKITGSYKKGIYDTVAVNGKDLTLTIDTELQQYGEILMKGKRGGIVAIEPSTGEILALITAPSYDPNMMVGRKRAKNSTLLFEDKISKPMFDRSLTAQYAPGSPFKIMNALIGLQESVIDEKTHFLCYKGYQYGKRKEEFMGCHCGIINKPIQLKTAISKSCNSYFSNTFKRIIEKGSTASKGLDNWNKHLQSFGFGNFLGYDLPAGRKGRIPTGKFYDNRINYQWNAASIISNAIGQGDVETTPIQLANFTAAVANKGFFYTPHIVKKINNTAIDNKEYTIAKKTSIDQKHFDPIIEAMHEVFKTGTGKYNQVKGIEICGKTGTVENFTRINGEKVSLPDHSILIAFAPKENPKIALAVFVENGGYGSVIAAPIASLLIEKYLKGTISRKWVENNMITKNLQDIYNQQIQNKEVIEAGTK